MKYIKWDITAEPLAESRELLYPILGDLGFDSFEEAPKGLHAYIPQSFWRAGLVQEVKQHPWLAATTTLEIEESDIAEENWNQVWESNFQPIEVGKELFIRAPFHQASSGHALDLLIQPQMSFGTGHHETTWQMCKTIMQLDLKEKQVLDMGSGTGILAILCEKQGASSCLGIEIEAPAVDNAKENAALNNCSKCEFIHGDASLIPNQKYDLVVANINRNVLLSDLKNYYRVMAPGSVLLLSGFYTSDNELLINAAEEIGLNLVNTSNKNDWSLLHFIA